MSTLLLIHDVDVWIHGKNAIEDRFREAMSGAYVALDKLRSEGVVAGIGIGVNEAEMCVRFAPAGSLEVMLLAGRPCAAHAATPFHSDAPTDHCHSGAMYGAN
jgi:hypothetical protein